MTPDESFELGHLLERHQRDLEATARGGPGNTADILNHDELVRLATLSVRAHRELPTGETEIVRKMRVDGEWQDRLVAVEQAVLKMAASFAAGVLQAEVVALLKR